MASLLLLIGSSFVENQLAKGRLRIQCEICNIWKLGMVNPLPEKLIRDFAAKVKKTSFPGLQF